MEFSGLTGMTIMEMLTGWSDHKSVTERDTNEAERIARSLSYNLTTILDALHYPVAPEAEYQIPRHQQRLFRALIDQVEQIKHNLLGRRQNKRALSLRAAQLLVTMIPGHGRKDAIGELFLLYVRSHAALKNRSALGMFLAMQTFTLMKMALRLGSPEHYEAILSFVKGKKKNDRAADSIPTNETAATDEYLTEVYALSMTTGTAFEDGEKWGKALHKSVLQFITSREGSYHLSFDFDSHNYDQERVEIAVMKALMLCLGSFRERRKLTGPDSFNQASEGFIEAATITFSTASKIDFDSIEDDYENGTLFDNSGADLVAYLFEGMEHSGGFGMEDWKLEVDNQGYLVPMAVKPHTPPHTPLRTKEIRQFPLTPLSKRKAPEFDGPCLTSKRRFLDRLAIPENQYPLPYEQEEDVNLESHEDF